MLADLDDRGIAYAYEPHQMEYTLDCKYTPDIGLPCNGDLLIEVKGNFKPADRRKMLAVKRAHPEADIRFVFMRAGNKISKVSKTTYAQWSEKHGFPYAEGKVPDDWVK